MTTWRVFDLVFRPYYIFALLSFVVVGSSGSGVAQQTEAPAGDPCSRSSTETFTWSNAGSYCYKTENPHTISDPSCQPCGWRAVKDMLRAVKLRKYKKITIHFTPNPGYTAGDCPSDIVINDVIVDPPEYKCDDNYGWYGYEDDGCCTGWA
jgi:hypothetical protein